MDDEKWGDHTYVCIKKRKKKHGRLRTIRNYGCHNQPHFGNPWGGSERGRWLVRKSKSTKKAKDGALKVTHKWYCRMIYGVAGLCHQEANRVLYGARKAHAGFGRNIHGYLNGRTYSYYQYGRYGKGWWSCKFYAY